MANKNAENQQLLESLKTLFSCLKEKHEEERIEFVKQNPNVFYDKIMPFVLCNKALMYLNREDANDFAREILDICTEYKETVEK